MDFLLNSWESKVRLPPRNMALIAGLIKGNQWVFIVPKNKAGYLLGGIALVGVPEIPMINDAQMRNWPGGLSTGQCTFWFTIDINHSWIGKCSMYWVSSVWARKTSHIVRGVQQTRNNSTCPTVTPGPHLVDRSRSARCWAFRFKKTWLLSFSGEQWPVDPGYLLYSEGYTP